MKTPRLVALWTEENAQAAWEEGWIISNCGNPLHLHAVPGGPLLEDAIAHKEVVKGAIERNEDLCFKALEFIAAADPEEFKLIYDPLT